MGRSSMFGASRAVRSSAGQRRGRSAPAGGQAGRAIWGVLSSRSRDGMFPRALRGAGSREPAQRSSLGSGDRGQPGNGHWRRPGALGQAGPHVDTNSSGHRDRIQHILQQRHRARTATRRARSPAGHWGHSIVPGYLQPCWVQALSDRCSRDLPLGKQTRAEVMGGF